MRGLERRLVLLEGGRGGDPYAHLSDEELEARIAELTAAIGDEGVVFPADWDCLWWPAQQAWLRQSIAEAAQ